MDQREKKIVEVERLIFKDEINYSLKSFKKINDNFWVTNTRWPFGVYNVISKITEVKVFPFGLKNWLITFKNFLVKGNKKHNLLLLPQKLFGNLIVWCFLSSMKFNVIADVVFLKGSRIILMYLHKETPSLIKIFSNERNYNIEKEGLLLANNISHKKVAVPKLKYNYAKDKLFFIEQELIFSAKAIRFSGRNKINEIFGEVMGFMFDFYKLAGVRLCHPSEFMIQSFDEVERYLNTTNGDTSLRIFKNLVQRNKKLLVGKRHGDLNVDNILYDKNRDFIYIIDWGESMDGFLIWDLYKGGAKRAAIMVEEICTHFGFRQENLYSIEEQMYIDTFVKLLKKIEKRFNQGNLNPSLTKEEKHLLSVLPKL